MIENSWLLTVKSQHKLHDKMIALCECGERFQVEYYSYLSQDNLSCCCPVCYNISFLNLHIFDNSTTKKQFLNSLHYEIVQENIQDTYVFNAILRVPFWGQAQQTILYNRKILMSLVYVDHQTIEQTCKELGYLYVLDDQGRMRPLKYALEHALYNVLSDCLFEYFLHKKPIALKKELLWISREFGKKRYEVYQFFISNPNYNTFELYYWAQSFLLRYIHQDSLETIFHEILQNQCKAVKRIFFRQYISLNLLKSKITYDPSADYCFMKSFKDINYIQSLIAIPYRKKQHCINTTNGEEVFLMIDLLKKFYAEKKIANLFLSLFDSLKTDTNMLSCFHDILKFFSPANVPETLKISLKAHKLTIYELHDELVAFYNSSNIQLTNIMFTYLPKFKQACMTYDELEFRLPTSDRTLQEWGRILHNCLSTYAGYIDNQEGVIYGVFIENKLTYAIKISSELKLIEARANYNKPIQDAHMNIIIRWFEEAIKKE